MSENEGNILKIKRFSVHDGPGIRTAVFLKGCPLNCIWCHSPEGIASDLTIWYNLSICIACSECVKACPEKALKLIPGTKPFIEIDRAICKTSGECVNICPTHAMQFTGFVRKVSEIVGEIEKDIPYYRSSGGGVTLTGGEPLYQTEFSSNILEECKKREIHTAIETSLYCSKETISRVLDMVDLFIIDIKIYDPVQHEYFTGKRNDIILENFTIVAKSGKDVVVRIPLIKNITDTEINKSSIIGYVHRINKNIPIEFIEFNPLAENNYNRLGIPFRLTAKN